MLKIKLYFYIVLKVNKILLTVLVLGTQLAKTFQTGTKKFKITIDTHMIISLQMQSFSDNT